MYRLYGRPMGTTMVPDASSYEILNPYSETNLPFVIYDQRSEGITKYVESPKAELGYNIAGTCTFRIKDGHPFYSKILPYKTEVLLYDDDECIWMGRVVNIEHAGEMSKDFDVSCEGLLAVFNDITIWTYDGVVEHINSWSVADCIDYYIAPTLILGPSVKRDSLPQFYISSHAPFIVENTTKEVSFVNPSHTTGLDYMTMKEFLDQIAAKTGGYFFIKPYLDTTQPSGIPRLFAALYFYHKIPTSNMETGSPMSHVYNAYLNINVTEIKNTHSIDSFATVITPRGALYDTNPETIAMYKPMERYGIEGYTRTLPSSVSTYIIDDYSPMWTPICKTGYVYNATAVDNFGWIEKKMVYDDLTSADDILANAIIDLNNSLLQQAGVELTFSTLLSASNSGPLKINYNRMPRIFDGVIVHAASYGISESIMPILDISIDLENPIESKVSLCKTGATYISNAFNWRR